MQSQYSNMAAGYISSNQVQLSRNDDLRLHVTEQVTRLTERLAAMGAAWQFEVIERERAYVGRVMDERAERGIEALPIEITVKALDESGQPALDDIHILVADVIALAERMPAGADAAQWQLAIDMFKRGYHRGYSDGYDAAY
jgi:hypothetical protein